MKMSRLDGEPRITHKNRSLYWRCGKELIVDNSKLLTQHVNAIASPIQTRKPSSTHTVTGAEATKGHVFLYGPTQQKALCFLLCVWGYMRVCVFVHVSL